MAHKPAAEYGRAGSREELEKSGYRLPPSFFVEAKRDGSGEPTEEEVAADKAAKPAPAENKALAPVDATKASAKKSARTRK